MKYFFAFIFIQFSLFSFATPTENVTSINNLFESAELSIDNQLDDLQQVNQIIMNEGLTYNEFATNYPSLMEETNLAASGTEDLFSTDNPTPLGIHGFWWGLVLGCLGLGIVYFSMDPTADRKDSMKAAALGCLLSGLIGGGLWWQVFN